MAPQTDGRGMGRLVSPDERDKRYPMRLMLDPAREQFFPRGIPEGASHFLPAPPIIVQGNTGTCTAHAGTTFINAPPMRQKLPIKPFDLYRRLILRDQWPENDYEATADDHQLQFGSSIRALLEELIAMGYIKSYLWAEGDGVEDVRAWMMARFAGIIAGTLWTTGMMDTDSEGFVSYTGNVEGGHAYYMGGWNDRVKHNGRYVRAVRCQQSWPLPWGHRGQGRFWIEADDLAKMKQDDGEFAAPTEVRVTPLKVD